MGSIEPIELELEPDFAGSHTQVYKGFVCIYLVCPFYVVLLIEVETFVQTRHRVSARSSFVSPTMENPDGKGIRLRLYENF